MNEGLKDLKTLTIRKLNKADEDALDSIVPKAFYSTSVGRSTLQSALENTNQNVPDSKLEKTSDEVRYKAARYNEKVEPWQRFSTKWDRAQLRNQCTVLVMKILNKSNRKILYHQFLRQVCGRRVPKQTARKRPVLTAIKA